MIAYITQADVVNQIEYYCLENADIKAAAVLEYDSMYIVAVMTYPLFSRSQRNSVFDTIKMGLVNEFGKNIILTDDLEVYSKILLHQKGKNIQPSDIASIAKRRAI